jgi:ketosteroid isomerase-like protein
VSSENVDRTREAFAALSRGDAEWLIAHSDPEIELHLQGVAGEPVRYTGAEGIRDYFHDMAESWESFGFEPEEIRDLGDSVFAIAIQRLRGRASGIDVETKIGAVVDLRDGKAWRLRGFLDVADALAAAGLDE